MTNPSIETILADDHFVRALARRLVRDSATAEDVAQTAYLHALRGVPPEHPSARGWIAAVVRNVAASLGRSEERRTRHERSAARDAEVTPESDLIEREEVRRALVAAVLDLGAPRSTVVVLRYFEDLPPRVIARRMGMPVETVRSHLKRAHAELRRRLGAARHRGGGSMLGALPLCLELGDRTWMGIALMTTKTKLAGAAAVLVVGGVAWIATLGEGSSDGPVAAIEPNAAVELVAPEDEAFVAERGRTSSVPLPEAAAVETVRADPPLPSIALRGRVLDSSGLPVRGAFVRALRPDGRGPTFLEQDLFLQLVRRDALVPDDAVRSGPGGEFEVRDLRPSQRYDLAAWHAEFGVVLEPEFPIRVDAAEHVVLQFAPAVILSGRVTDGSGRPVDGAEVEVEVSRGGATFHSFLRTRTARDGTWRTPPAHHASFSVSASAPGRIGDRRVLTWTPGLEREIRADFALAPAPIVRGRFVLAGGSSPRLVDELASRGFGEDLDAFVLLGSSEAPVADGEFRSRDHEWVPIDWDEDRWEHAASDETPAFVSLWFHDVLLGAVGATTHGESELVVHVDRLPRATPTRTIVIRCRDDRGEVVADVELTLRPPMTLAGDAASNRERSVEDETPDGGGRIAEAVRAGAYELRASARGHASRIVPLVVVEGEGSQTFDVVLARAECEVEVLARSAEGEPVDGAEILVLDADGRPVPSLGRIATDLEGRAVIRGLGAGEHTFLADHPELVAASRRVTLEPGTSLVRFEFVEGVEVHVDLVGFEGATYLRATDEFGLVVLEDLCRGTSRGTAENLRLLPGRHVLLARGERSGTAEVAFDAQRGAVVEIRASR